MNVHVPATASDLAGNTLGASYNLSFDVASRTDTAAPTIYESQPPNLLPVDEIWQASVNFADDTTGMLELLDSTSVGNDDLLVTYEATGLPIRGFRASIDAGSGTVQLQSPPRSSGFSTMGGVQRTLLVALAGIFDFEGNAMAPTGFTANLVPSGTNRVPTVESLRDLRLGVTTSPLGRQLSAQLRVKDADNQPVTVSIAALGGTLPVTLTGTTQVLTNASPSFYGYSFGSDGPPTGASPPELDDTNFPTSGYYPFEITLDDGTDTTTYVRQVWVWAPTDMPVGVSIAEGATVHPVDVTRPIVLETGAAPTFTWSGVDVANSDFLALQYLELSPANVGGGSGGPAGVPLDPTLTTFPFPLPLEPTIYAWFVTEMKFSPGETDPAAQGWSLDFSKLLASAFVVGPANRSLGGRDFGAARASFATDRTTGAFAMAWDATGRYGLEQRTAGQSAPVVVTETLTRNDGTIPAPATEFFAAGTDGSFMVTTTDPTMGLPLASRGFMGRGGRLFAVAAQDQASVGIEAGAYRDPALDFTGGIDGTVFAFVQTEIRTDTLGALTGHGASVGEAAAGATEIAVSLTQQDGSTMGPFPVPYTVGADGFFRMDISGTGTEFISGYLGGDVGKEIGVLACDSSDQLSFLLIMARMFPWLGTETEALLDGQYHFVEYTVGADGTGSPTEVHASSGVATFGGASRTFTYAVSSSFGARTGAGSFTLTAVDIGGGVYRGSVALLTDPGTVDEATFLLTVGPDANTIFGVSQGKPDVGQILIFSK